MTIYSATCRNHYIYAHPHKRTPPPLFDPALHPHGPQTGTRLSSPGVSRIYVAKMVLTFQRYLADVQINEVT